MSESTPLELNPRKLRCEEWEALLADALDGALTRTERASFDLHTSQCPACNVMLGEAQKGQQWLQFLHPQPPVPAGLVEKILFRTIGTPGPLATRTLPALPVAAAVQRVPEWKRFSVPAGARRLVEPRIMMTAAMAFFSIAVTLNMAGVRLTSLRGQDLRPSVLRSNLERQFYTAKAPVVRYYENLRVVYEVESRMRELRRTSESDESRTPPKTEPQKPAVNKESGGSAHKNGGKSESPRTAGPPAVLAGRPIRASLEVLPDDNLPGDLRMSRCEFRTTEAAKHEADEAENSLFSKRADQAERSLA